MEQTKRCHGLGLGRGVNVTDPRMWKNKSYKSSFCVRELLPNLSNIIWTEELESGLKEMYKKEVSTVATEQLKLKFSLEDPSTQVKIGMDAQNCQSTNSTKRINGIKSIHKVLGLRLILMIYPPPTGVREGEKPNDSESGDDDVYNNFSEDSNSFENRLCSWILKRINSRTKKEERRHSSVTADSVWSDNAAASKELQALLKKMEDRSDQRKRVAHDCEVFVQKLGMITHYVSAIELGALRYNMSSVSESKLKMGANAELGFRSIAEGGVGKSIEKHLFHKMKMEQEIGRINKDGEVERDTSDEAVIGFQIQPIYKLVRKECASPSGFTESNQRLHSEKGRQNRYEAQQHMQCINNIVKISKINLVLRLASNTLPVNYFYGL